MIHNSNPVKMKMIVFAQIYPWVTQTFTFHEILGWRQHNIDVGVLSIKRPSEKWRQTLTRDMLNEIDGTIYLSDVKAMTFLRSLKIVIIHPIISIYTLYAVMRGSYLKKPSLRSRIVPLLVWFRAVSILSVVERGNYEWIHAEFADEMSTLAWIISKYFKTPYSIRSHSSANPQMIKEKIEDAKLILTISQYDKNQLVAISPESNHKIIVSYLGVDIDKLNECNNKIHVRESLILCVGRLSKPKGHSVLLAACDILAKKGVEFRCLLVGDGPLENVIRDEIKKRHLEQYVQLEGYKNHHDAISLMAKSMIFCLPCMMDKNGNIDGIPIVLMEAMALGKACISTRLSGIPELIEDNVNGLLAPPNDVQGVAERLEMCLKNPSLRERLGNAAKRTVQSKFNLRDQSKKCTELLNRFRGR